MPPCSPELSKLHSKLCIASGGVVAMLGLLVYATCGKAPVAIRVLNVA